MARQETQKKEIFKYHNSAERVLFSDLRNSLLSVSITMLVIAGDSDFKGVCPSGYSAPPDDYTLGAMPQASQFLVLKLPADPALHPNEFCSLPV